MNIQAWGEVWQERARRRWSDEPLRYDSRDGTEFTMRGCFVIGSPMMATSAPITTLDMAHPSVILTKNFHDGEFLEPLPGHLITRVKTDEVYEVVNREKGRCWKHHGESNLEIEIYLSSRPIE